MSVDQWLDLYDVMAQGQNDTLTRLRELETLFDQDDFTVPIRGRMYRYTRTELTTTEDQKENPTA